jgi:lipopolysaccharide export system permease protein
MRTIDRYIAGTFLRNFLVSALALTVLYVFQALLGELLSHEFPAHQVIVHNLLQVPQIFVQMSPPAILLATVLTLSGMNRSNELVACYCVGVGLTRIVSVIVSLSFILACLSLVMQDRILPPFFKKRTTYYWREMKKKPDFFLDIKQNKIWYRSKNVIYNLRTFDIAKKQIIGMAVYTFDEDFNLRQVIDAEKADYTPSGWKLRNGTVTVFQKDDPFPLNQKFEEKELLIAEKPVDFEEIEKEVDGLRIKELWKYIAKIKEAGGETKVYEVKLHSRFSLSFIPMVMCLLGVPFSTRSRREGGMAKDLALCLAITFFYWLFYSVGLSLGQNGALPPWLGAWLPSAVFGALAIWLILRKQST